MPLGQLHLYSPSLQRQTTVGIYVPSPELEPPYPALLQLHGRGDDYASWFEHTMLPVYVQSYPFLVVTPSGDVSFWSNLAIKGPGTAYEDYLIQDLMPEIERIFPVRRDRWAIGGLSMGGFGAVRLGLLYPDRFASIYAHSGTLWSADRLREQRPDMPAEDLAAADIFRHADRALTVPNRPVLAFDCGLDDFLLADNRAFHQHLERIGFLHTYREFPGGHTWHYWNEHVREALAHHAGVMGI